MSGDQMAWWPDPGWLIREPVLGARPMATFANRPRMLTPIEFELLHQTTQPVA